MVYLLVSQYRSAKITEVTLSVFVYRLFHEDFFVIVRTNPESI